MANRSFYTYKFRSSRLKEAKYTLDITFNEARKRNEVISLADSQILRSIRRIRGREVDYMELEFLFSERDYLRRKNDVKDTSALRDVQNKINSILEVPEYVTVVIDELSHYDYIFKNGICLNGKLYKRLSCSAGQARKSTVVLCDTEILDVLKDVLNNGRNPEKPLAPSKFNAYFGLAGSATKVVSEPKFIVIRDYTNTTSFLANYLTENPDWDKDDTLDVRMIEDMPMNRTDGMGLISPELSERWAKELDLDYIPAQWCIRQSFIKGMVCTFPIHQFCEEVAGGNYMVETIYKDEAGNPIMADLREYDMILTESQFKLWDSFPSMEVYIENYHKNDLAWGVSQYTPKRAKDTLTLNYQFIQTLDLDKDGVRNLCSQFVDWISGVSYDNFAYMVLFLMGVGDDEDRLRNWMRSSDNWWLKSMILCPDLKNDKFIRTKIRELIKTKIHNGCMGEICVDGNFQVMVSDPYGFMQHACGLPVTGLLGKDEFYCNYWNERGVTQVDSMRSPLTYRSEHVIANLVKNEETEKWYRYCYLGFILNYHGHDSVCYAGSDYDYDICSSTSNQTMINGVYRDELPVVYDPPSPKKILFTEEDLYRADTFGFGSIIGSITNKSSIAYALLPLIERDYGKDSEEYRLTVSRLQQCCAAQSRQIDKTKIGQVVKGIPKVWVEKQDDEFYNRILLNKYPYFFRYRYKKAKDDFKKYEEQCNAECKQKFRIPLEKLLKLEQHTENQQAFLDNYYKYMPVVYSDSPMNLLCRHIENIDFGIRKKIREDGDFDYRLFYDPEHMFTEEEYAIIVQIIKEFKTIAKAVMTQKELYSTTDFDFAAYNRYRVICEAYMEEMESRLCDRKLIANCFVKYFYEDNPKSNKEFLWDAVGQILFENLRENLGTETILFPFMDPDGDITYLNNRYTMREVSLHDPEPVQV